MQGILGRQIEAERQALERDAMNLRGGVLRQEPSMMQKIGGAIADYAVPDRYSSSSVMEPRLNMEQLESLRGTPVNMADVPNPVPMLMDTMPMAGITAFHGSPHKFSKFDMSKIGTGEGAQAYGHGLYFAENPQTAKQYRDAFSSRLDAEIVGGEGKTKIPQWLAYSIEQGDTTIDDAIADWASRAKNQRDLSKLEQNIQPWQNVENAVRLEKTLGELKKIKSSGGHSLNRMNHLYKVDIPDEHIDKMLDWDKSLSGQGEEVLKLADKYGVSHNADGGTLLELMSANLRSKALASDEIQELGIKGIKYLDQGSRGAGKGTSNFVVFDDQIPQILEINDKPMKGLLSE